MVSVVIRMKFLKFINNLLSRVDLLRRWLVLSLRGGFDGFHPSRQNAPREQHLSPAAQALKPDVCTQADDFPFITAAGMGLAQPDHVIDL